MLTVRAALLVGASGLVGALGAVGVFHVYVAGVARVGRASCLATLFLPARVVLALHLVCVVDLNVAAGAGDGAAKLLLGVVGFCGKRNTEGVSLQLTLSGHGIPSLSKCGSMRRA